MLSEPIIMTLVGGIVPERYEALVWGPVGIVAILLLGFGLMWIRKKYHPTSSSGNDLTASFSIESIEAMRNSGKISNEEFHRLRVVSLGLDASMTDSNNSTLSTHGDVDDDTDQRVVDIDVDDDDQQEHKEKT
ncbi:MAG: hypothetical protein GY794_04825 [bacterium]|nr:hypothetical protein [bacterium]